MRHEQIHIHQRTRKHDGEKCIHPYPSPKPLIKYVDKIVSITAILYPLTLLPQAISIWYTQNAEGVSLLTWSALFILSTPLFLYALLHKEKKLTIMYGMFVVIYIATIIGIIIYG